MKKNICHINETYLNYMYNLSRDDFFNSDGKAYFGRQILFLGDSHGWGEGSPNYQGVSSGFYVHTPWIHSKGFFNRTIDYLYKKMDTQPWRCIPFVNKNSNLKSTDIPGDIHVGSVYSCSQDNTAVSTAFFDEVTYTCTPAFVKGRYWVYESIADDNTDSNKEALNVFCNAETRSDSYSVMNYSYNADIGLLGKGVFVLATDIDRPTEEFYRVTAYCGTQNECNKDQYHFCSSKCGGIDSRGVGFLIVSGELNTLPDWLKIKGQRIYAPELGALTIVSTENLFIKGDSFIKLSVRKYTGSNSDPLDIDIKTLEASVYPGMLIYKSYHGESCVLMDIKTPTRYLVLSLITHKKYGAKAKIELLSKMNIKNSFISPDCSDNSEYYGNEAPCVYRLALPVDNKNSYVPALNAVVDCKSIKDKNVYSIIIDTSDNINANSEEFYIIDFKQKKQGTVRISISGPGKYNTEKHPATNTEVLMSRGMLCGNMDLFRNWSMGGHSIGAWLGLEESYWKDTRNHLRDATRYMTSRIKGVVIETPIVNEWLKQTPVDIFKSRLTDIIEILKCSNVIIFTTIGLKDREFGVSNEGFKKNSEITFDQYSLAVREWAQSQPISEPNNITFIDCRRYLKDLVFKGIIKPDNLYINDAHPSPAVNEIIADMLITAIKFKY